MSRQKLNALLSEIRQRREQTLVELADLGETEFDYETDGQRWSDVRRFWRPHARTHHPVETGRCNRYLSICLIAKKATSSRFGMRA